MLHADNSSTLTSMLIFMTDGEPTEGETSSDKILSNVDAANSKNYPIHCIAFGDEADYKLLKRISSKNKGLARKIYEDSDSALQISGKKLAYNGTQWLPSTRYPVFRFLR